MSAPVQRAAATVMASAALAMCLLTACSLMFAPGEAGETNEPLRDAAVEVDGAAGPDCRVEKGSCPDGRCEADGRCSVYDEMCDSGRRYDSADVTLECVEPCGGGEFDDLGDAVVLGTSKGYVLGGVSADEKIFAGILGSSDGATVATFRRSSHLDTSGELEEWWNARVGDEVVFLARDGDTSYIRDAEGALRVGRFSAGEGLDPIPGIDVPGTDIWISADGLRAYLSTAAGIALLTRQSTSGDFASKRDYALPGVQSFALSSNELELIYAKDVGNGRGLDLFRAERDSLAADFFTGERLDGLNTANHDHRPVLTADGITLYLQHSDGLDGARDVTPQRAQRHCPL